MNFYPYSSKHLPRLYLELLNLGSICTFSEGIWSTRVCGCQYVQSSCGSSYDWIRPVPGKPFQNPLHPKPFQNWDSEMKLSMNRGSPKSSMKKIGCSLLNRAFLGTPILGHPLNIVVRDHELGGTPSYHPFSMGIFHERNQRYLGVPPLTKSPRWNSSFPFPLGTWRWHHSMPWRLLNEVLRCGWSKFM